MLKKHSLSTLKNLFFIGFSSFLFGTGISILAPRSSESFEIQWNPEPGYRRLKYHQSADEPLERATYFLFLRGSERKENIIKLTLKVPDYFDAKIKPDKLSLCKVIVGGYTERTRCKENVPSVIEVNENQTSIEIFPERPIPRNKDNYAVVMKLFNPRKPGMFQFQARSQSQRPGEIPISTYLGTWNISVVNDPG